MLTSVFKCPFVEIKYVKHFSIFLIFLKFSSRHIFYYNCLLLLLFFVIVMQDMLVPYHLWVNIKHSLSDLKKIITF